MTLETGKIGNRSEILEFLEVQAYFFNSGTRSAVFSESGTVADVNDELTMLVITGSKIGRHCFKIVDGIGSSAQHFSFLDLINIDINRW